MNDEWKRRPSGRLHAVVLGTVVVAIAVVFVYAETRREERLAEKSIRFTVMLDGTPVCADVTSARLTSGHWSTIVGTPSLRQLHIWQADDLGGGLERLATLPDLRQLAVGASAGLHDDDVAWICRELPLEELVLTECPNLTDACLDPLIGCESLTRVNLCGTPISIGGLKRIREARRDL